MRSPTPPHISSRATCLPSRDELPERLVDPERDIGMYINCAGGEVDAGLAISDTMHSIRPQVVTTCVGTAAGVGAALLAGHPGGGTVDGKR